MTSEYSSGGSLLRLFSFMRNRSIPRSFGYGRPSIRAIIPVAVRISAIHPAVLSLCSLQKITDAPVSQAIPARRAHMPTESASQSSMTFPAPKKRGQPGSVKPESDCTSPEPQGWRTGSAITLVIPHAPASRMFERSPASPGTITAPHPACATFSPTMGMFSSCRERIRSALKSDASMRAGSWVSAASGPLISSSW